MNSLEINNDQNRYMLWKSIVLTKEYCRWRVSFLTPLAPTYFQYVCRFSYHSMTYKLWWIRLKLLRNGKSLLSVSWTLRYIGLALCYPLTCLDYTRDNKEKSRHKLLHIYISWFLKLCEETKREREKKTTFHELFFKKKSYHISALWPF